MKLGSRTYLTFFLDKRASLVCHKCRPCLELHKDWRLTSPSCSFCSEGCRPSCICKAKKSNQNHCHIDIKYNILTQKFALLLENCQITLRSCQIRNTYVTSCNLIPTNVTKMTVSSNIITLKVLAINQIELAIMICTFLRCTKTPNNTVV